MKATLQRSIKLIHTSRQVTAAELMEHVPAREIVACDFHVQGIERYEEVVGGYQWEAIINVDHNAPVPRMQRQISSANLAIARADAGVLPASDSAAIVVNHLDCDSILSSGIISRKLDPDPRFGEAAIAADHTGAENGIADLLQALDAAQSRQGTSDLGLSFRNLESFINDRPLDSFAIDALDKRRRRREAAHRLAVRADIGHTAVALIVSDDPVDGEFFPALLPGATLIVLANPLPVDITRWQIKVRLGHGAANGLSLTDLRIGTFDPAFGGRWNAGSNRDRGGTDLTPERYAQMLATRLGAALNSKPSTDHKLESPEQDIS